MGLTLRTTLGFTEAVIDDDGGLKRFYQVAALLNDLKISFIRKEDEFDSINWSFHFGRHELTLHYSIYNGISIFPTRARDAVKKDNKAVVELANMLEDKLISGTRNIA